MSNSILDTTKELNTTEKLVLLTLMIEKLNKNKKGFSTEKEAAKEFHNIATLASNIESATTDQVTTNVRSYLNSIHYTCYDNYYSVARKIMNIHEYSTYLWTAYKWKNTNEALQAFSEEVAKVSSLVP